MTRVTHLVPALFDPDAGVMGGAERYALELATHMAERVPTRLVAFGPKHRVFTVGQLSVSVIGEPWRVRGETHNPIAPEIVSAVLRADVVHCHQRYILASSLAALVSRMSGRRVFVSDLGGGGWDISAYVPTDSWYHGHLHISEYSRTIAGHAGRASARVILGGVDTTRFSPASGTARTARVLFVGRLLPHKGVDDLIDAAGPDLPLDIIGPSVDPEYTAGLIRLAGDKPVTVRHDVDDVGLVEAYRRAMCVVLPSVYRTRAGHETLVPELLGQTLLEGMACGTPAVCTRVASMPEVVEDGVSGLVVPPNDPAELGGRLRWLRDHPAECRAMGEAARRRVVEKFTWPAVVDRCLDAYRSL